MYMQNIEIQNIQLRGHLRKRYAEYLSSDDYLISEDIWGKRYEIVAYTEDIIKMTLYVNVILSVYP